MDKHVFEETGLIPRSIIRTFDRFRRQLLPGTKKSMIQEFRVSRFQVLISVDCLIKLLLIPFFINLLVKNLFLLPITEYLWNTQQKEIFLNSYQEDRALLEMHDFQEKVFFESLVENLPSLVEEKPLSTTSTQNQESETNIYRPPLLTNPVYQPYLSDCKQVGKTNKVGKVNSVWYGDSNKLVVGQEQPKEPFLNLQHQISILPFYNVTNSQQPSSIVNTFQHKQPVVPQETKKQTSLSYGTCSQGNFSLPQNFKQKTIELAIYYNQQSIQSLTNLFGDFITFLTICFLFIWMKPEIIILKSFLTESIYSFSDTTKSFLLIILTDLLVGFHSPRGWEIFIELVLRHFGLPENQIFIFLFVASFPVLLDTLFKYWIFRYLNRISPSTVATYHTMIE